mmetsp:Transcript_19150/g.47662  ORF Transcript_19150/g.47662 Transcript_19150/m.47662 type:complete len:266 (-) Transcript_19150:1533-2330(-)
MRFRPVGRRTPQLIVVSIFYGDGADDSPNNSNVEINVFNVLHRQKIQVGAVQTALARKSLAEEDATLSTPLTVGTVATGIQTNDQTLDQSVDVSIPNIVKATQRNSRKDPSPNRAACLKELKYATSLIVRKPVVDRWQEAGIHDCSSQKRIVQDLWAAVKRSTRHTTVNGFRNPDLCIRNGAKDGEGQNVTHERERPMWNSHCGGQNALVQVLEERGLSSCQGHQLEPCIRNERSVGIRCGMDELSCKNGCKVGLPNSFSVLPCL